jgi:hypothetical protein
MLRRSGVSGRPAADSARGRKTSKVTRIGGTFMTLFRGIVTVVAVIALALSAARAEARGHFQSGSASIADNGDLVATFAESGVGKSPTTYHLQANYNAVYTCGGVVWGFISGGGPSWDTPSQNATLTGPGQITGTLSHPTAGTGSLTACPVGPIVLSSITWSNITVTDRTNGQVLALPDVSRTF